jgi:hypothetical protein
MRLLPSSDLSFRDDGRGFLLRKCQRDVKVLKVIPNNLSIDYSAVRRFCALDVKNCTNRKYAARSTIA